ncbi:ABC transporter ATP-binding protein [Pseudomonas citronellolis]|uniref:ABC transporter ATP-binding protein n=1 Tax=Pseudomonas citronellolis TaxID=53408 RepID=UPI0021BE1083|nr:ABC transporter ATP-binding protein [Pseudomonas citronellolis]UXJ53050.1 ABC transporter ATP-binding protein [Pseudomonas citronellolis]
MSSDTTQDESLAIRVSGLSKCFHIYDRPQDRLKQSLLPKLQRLVGRPTASYCRDFWALRDVSFELRKGETLGVIGRNGSGKSTLLQILCGTLSPTAGSVQVNGRVAALLELGAGFNPEFSGRENVFLNASFYGLSRQQIEQRFDSIAAFADIGDYIEQPVKTYSSGMFVRLAFGVIAHVDADILVIDEALSVGDAVFTQKCMRFIRRFQEHGTLLFVSHDMNSVLNLCQQGLWLKHGQVNDLGPAKQVTQNYLKSTLQEVYGEQAELENTAVTASPVAEAKTVALDYEAQINVEDNVKQSAGWKTGKAEVVSVTLNTINGDSSPILQGGETVRLVVEAIAHEGLNHPILGFLVKDRLGQDLFGENTLPFTATQPQIIEAGQRFQGTFVFTLPMLPNGQYSIMASVADGDLHTNIQHHYLHDALIVNVSSSKVRWGLVGVPFESVSLARLS